ncbi:MAG: radical SAM protein [Alphaproteobacteria bacterium]|nr:radical SAM protein [Alphaproteobacteria bacterium]MCB9796111.1 radical SAM protein [Alphaproteobacteria bacterium]
MSWTLIEQLRSRLAQERGPAFQPGPRRVVMLYPSPYRVGMSSLGFQWTCELLSQAGFAVERAFLPDDVEAWRASRTPLLTYETQSPVNGFEVVGVSLAYELELAGLITALELAGIPPLRRDRGPEHPRVILGGPLTFSNPLPATPFADLVLLGEAEESAPQAFEAALGAGEGWRDAVRSLPGALLPSDDLHLGAIPPVAKASDALLPARSRWITPDTELSDMFLLEGERGCHRACTFCVMRRSTNGGMRLVTPERVLSFVPEHAKRVGLVGAAISDHPKLPELLQALVDSGRGVGISSLRADRVARKPEIARLLREGGYSTLTVASDAASQRLRREISKGTLEKHLLTCAELAAEHRYRVLKVYMMLGLPGETDEDVDELIRFTKELSAVHPVALGIAPFVPKVNTPMVGAGFAGQAVVERRLQRLQKGLRRERRRVDVRATSARWAWVEAVLAQGGPATGEAVLAAVQAGGRFADYKRAFKEGDSETLKRLERAA